MSTQNLSESLHKVMSQFQFNHKGMLVNKIIGGYEWAGQKYKTLVELDTYIDKKLNKNPPTSADGINP